VQLQEHMMAEAIWSRYMLKICYWVLQVAAFEWLILAMLGVSAPVMLWRKWGMRTLLPL
jgi:hypothetical protein